MTAPIPPFPVAALAGIWLAGQRGGGDERTGHGMSDVVERAKHVLETRRAKEDNFWPRGLVTELVAEIERLHSWDGLMELLDEHWPEDIFPTLPDTDKRDPGPRIVSLLRMVDRINEQYQVICDQWAEANGRLKSEVERLKSDIEHLRASLSEGADHA